MKQIVVLAAMLGAAWPAAGSEYRAVDWYVAHPDEMAAVLQSCRNHAGLAARNPNCINAEEAQFHVAERESEAVGGIVVRPPNWADPKNSWLIPFARQVCEQTAQLHRPANESAALNCAGIR